MNKRRMAVWVGGLALLASGSAMAGVDVSVGIGVPVAPVYVPPPPVYVAPQPAIVAYPAYGYEGDEDDDHDRKWRKHYYKHWHKHHDDDD